MDCRDCQDLLIDYLDGSLHQGEAQAFQDHLRGCPACQKEEAALMTVLREARAPLSEPSELFWVNFLPRVREGIAARPEPWFSLLFKPAVGWGSLSLATLALLAGLLFWRMAPAWRAAEPKAYQSDYLTYETGYGLDEHLAQVVETSKDQTAAQRKVFEKLSPKDNQGQGTQVKPGDGEDLDNLLQGLNPEQRKALEEKLQNEIKELEQNAKAKEA
jgi:hypothetical protein